MEDRDVSFEDWLEMTKEADGLQLQLEQENIRTEIEEWETKVESMRRDPRFSENDIQSLWNAINVKTSLLRRIEQSNDDFDEEISNLED